MMGTDWCCDCSHEDEMIAWSDRCRYFCAANARPGVRPWGHNYAEDSPFRRRELGTFPDRDGDDRLVMGGEYVCPYCGARTEFSEEAVIRHIKSCQK